MAEIDHLLTLDAGELVTYTDNPALAQINFWLDTPKGEYWGRPEWGHRLNEFRHEPLTAALEVQLENAIIMDLERDLPALTINGISLTLLDVDQFRLSVNTNFGLIADRLISI